MRGVGQIYIYKDISKTLKNTLLLHEDVSEFAV